MIFLGGKKMTREERRKKRARQRQAFLALCAVMLCLLIWGIFAFVSSIFGTKLDSKIIVLDPGHGATDIGCSYDGVNEADINMDIALLLKDLLEKEEYTVVMTHDGSEYISPSQRAEFANDKKAGLFISIHQNAAEDVPDAEGIETYYNSSNKNAKKLAKTIHQALIKSTEANDRGYMSRDDLIVTRETDMPSVLIECGFLSNANERYLLTTAEYQTKIAQAIADAVAEYAK